MAIKIQFQLFFRIHHILCIIVFMTNNTTLYDELFKELTEMIEKGVYIPGDKLPSVRSMAKGRNISNTTVLKAYRSLESAGLINTIPQSGFYVSYKAGGSPNITTLESRKTEIDTFDLDQMLSENPDNPTLHLFGAGRCDKKIVNVPQMNTYLSKLIHSSEMNDHMRMPIRGNEELRKQIIKLMYLKNSNITPDEIIIMTNCFSAIYFAFTALCSPNDLIAVESPCNYGALKIFKGLHLRVVEIPPGIEGGIDIEKLKTAIDTYDIKAIYVNPNCNNPLGTIMPDHKKKELADLANDKQIPIVEDDAAGELFYTKNHPSSIVSYDRNGYVLFCSSFSKIFSDAFHLGWIAAGRYTEAVLECLRTAGTQVSALIQVPISIYLQSNSYQVHLRRIRKTYKQRVENMLKDIRAFFPHCPFISNPEGGYLVWVKLPNKLSSMELYKELLPYNLSVMPGKFFSTDDRYLDYIRLCAAQYDLSNRHCLKKVGDIIFDMLCSGRGTIGS